MKAWTFQDKKQLAKRGAKACPWSVGWYDNRGRKRQKTVGTKTHAKAYARKLEGEQAAGLLRSVERVRWAEFVERFDRDHLKTIAASSREQSLMSLKQFLAVIKPAYLDQVTTAAIDEFRAKRLKQGVSVATVNKDLRHVRGAMSKAKRWGLIAEPVVVEMLREAERDPEFVDDDDFAKLYAACDSMLQPDDRHFSAADWWRALLTFAYLTGWRIREILALEWENVDLEGRTAFVEAARTKGKRDARIELHPAVCEHLRALKGFDTHVFRWPLYERGLWEHFGKLKKLAKVEFSGAFHRLRFGFANANVGAVPEDVLQQLMRHKDRQTTRRYVNIAHRMRHQGTAEKLHVPEVLKRKA